MTYSILRWLILPGWFWLAAIFGLTFLASLFFKPLRAWRRDLLWLSVVAFATGTICYSVMYFAP